MNQCDVMQAWRDWMRARGLREDQIEWFMRKGYAWCRYLRDALA